ncbi:MAG: tetratricopeptide repeat protein [Archangium sp.]
MTPELKGLLLLGLEQVRTLRPAEGNATCDRLTPLLLVEGEPDVPALQAAAILFFACSRFHEAISHLRRAATSRDPRKQASSLELLLAHAGRLGWEAEALEAGRQLQSIRPTPSLDLRELNRLSRQRDAAGVIERARRLLTSGPPDLASTVRIELCNALASSFAVPELRAELSILGKTPTRIEEALELITLHVEADQCAEAEALALEAHRQFPGRSEPLVWCSRFRCWSGDAEQAESRAHEALQRDASSADAWCALGAALDGQKEGVAAIDRACELDPRHQEAFTWLADRHERAGDADAMARALDVAVSSAKQLPVMAWLLRGLGALRDDLPPDHLSYVRFQECGGALDALVPGALEGLLTRKRPSETRSVLQAVRAALRGNYGEHATQFKDERLSRLPPSGRDGPRFASRRALELLRSRSVDDALATLIEVERAWPRSSLPACHRAEALLWAGRLDEAEREFRRALELVRGTRFAWIGLTGVACLRGRYAEALRISAEGVETMGNSTGPAVFVYRGEVLRQLGRLDEARADLEQAVKLSPRRLGATLNLALVDDDPRLQAVVFDRAPGLISDATYELREAGVAAPSRRAILERALLMMRGNRSTSLITYWCGGYMRLVPNEEGAATHVHQYTAREVELAIDVLKR